MDITKIFSRIKTLHGKSKESDVPVLGRGDAKFEPDFEIDLQKADVGIESADEEIVDEELPSVNRRAKGSGGIPKLLILAAFFIMAYFAFTVMSGQQQVSTSVVPAPPPPEPVIVNNMPPLIMPASTVPPPEVVATIPVQAPIIPPEPDWVNRKVNSAVLLDEKDMKSAAPSEVVALPSKHLVDNGEGMAADRLTQDKMIAEANHAEGELSENLKPLTITRGVQAGILANRNYMIAKGAALDCALETAIDSSLSGMVTCRLTRDVYSDNGRVIMLDRGSQLVGEYKSGVNNGLVRIFVLWTRAKTPKGVVVDLDSPATDALGRTGLEGFVDQHFIQRYGSAIMLSSVQEYLEILRVKEMQKTNVTVTGGSTAVLASAPSQRPKVIEQIATDVLKKSTMIQPVLYINQGANVQVMVVRDLDFSKVYNVESKAQVEE